jgi:hypothetical protein
VDVNTVFVSDRLACDPGRIDVTRTCSGSLPRFKALNKNFAIRAATVFLVTLSVSSELSPAAQRHIGVAVSQTVFGLNGLRVPGNATVYEGDALETTTSVCRVYLNNGEWGIFSKGSRCHLFARHVDIEAGSGRIFGYAATARGLSVRPDTGATGTVSVTGKIVEVAALTGNLHVYNSRGTIIANLAPGRILNLEPGSEEQSGTYSLSGCVVEVKGKSLMTDPTTNVTVELRGTKIPAGHPAKITGIALPDAQPVPGTDRVIRIQKFTQLPGTCPSASVLASGAAAGVSASAAGIAVGTASAAGVSVASAGVAVASIGAGAVAAGVGVSLASTSSAVTATTSQIITPQCMSPCTLH